MSNYTTPCVTVIPAKYYVYAVRNKTTGKWFHNYYKDGEIPKTWTTIGAARGRLTWANRKTNELTKHEYELVEFLLTEIEFGR